MKTYECDILIVGAGPAGSSAALTAARKGLRVLVVERRSKVGIPVRCAEHIPKPLLGEVNLGRHFIVQSVSGMRTMLPDGEVMETPAPGFIIRRDIFDQTLAEAAKDSGAMILLSTRALSKENGEVVLKGIDGQLSKAKAKVIIGADGPHTTVGKWFGSINQNLIPAVQVRVSLCHPTAFTEVYFDKEFFGGYAWLFPKGNEANVGMGMRKQGGERRSIGNVLDHFVSRLIKEGRIRGKPYGRTAGWIPAEPIRTVVHGNMLLVGDAAGQTHPITGAGLQQAVICGRMAGVCAATAIRERNLSLLSEYETEYRDLFGDMLNRGFERRKMLEGEWDRLEKIIKYCWITFGEYYARSRA